MDPAFNASLLGLRHWAYAWWEAWLKPEWLVDAFQLAAKKLDNLNRWNRAHGPVTGMLCSLNRVGWLMPSAEEVTDHEGYTWNFLRDSPAAILQAGNRAVRRWRLERICAALPGLAPTFCDAGLPSGVLAAGTREQGSFLLDFADVLKRLCKGAKPSKGNAFWLPTFKGDLTSAITGGQWTQARRASVREWKLLDDKCQLCLLEKGTLAHRLHCTATCPAGGWPEAPKAAGPLCRRLIARRKELLVTRGLLVVRLPMPPTRHESFTWLWQVEGEWPEDARWYIDGSMFNREAWQLRAVGFGIVVVSLAKGLVAFGGGHPPQWIRTAAGAEAWALYTVVRLCAAIPSITTDCMALLDTAERGQVRATGPKMILANIWVNICNATDGDLQSLRSSLTWMPAHLTLAMVGRKTLSNGKLVTAMDWGTNRLVDAVAKAFAQDNAATSFILKTVTEARAAVLHHASLLGAVTHAANHHPVAAQRKDGTSFTKFVRDVSDYKWQPTPASGRSKHAPNSGDPAAPTAQASTAAALPGRAPSPKPVRQLAESQLQRRRLATSRKRSFANADQANLDRRVEEIGASLSGRAADEPGCGPLEVVLRRIRSRITSQ